MKLVEFIKNTSGYVNIISENKNQPFTKNGKLLEFKHVSKYILEKRRMNRERVQRCRDKKRELEINQAPEKK